MPIGGWSSLPGVCELLGQRRWPQPLRVIEDDTDMMYGDYSNLFDIAHVRATLRGVRGDPAEKVRIELDRYPAAKGVQISSSSIRRNRRLDQHLA